MPDTDKPTCGHTYSRTSGMTFRCDAEPHPQKPDAHYFVRDLVQETRLANLKKERQFGSRMTVVR